MTDQPPLPPPDLGSVRIGRVDQDLGHSDDAMRAYGAACAAQEREACAKLCDEQRDTWDDGSDQWGNPCLARVRATPAMCAAAIRARGTE